MPDNKSISQLTTAEQTTSSDLFETSIPNGSLGYLSRKVSLDSIADYIGNDHLFSSDLQTTNKTLTGAINEAAQSGGGGASIEEMTQAEYNALTPEQKADGTLRAISDATTSINDIDDVNITSVADGDVLSYDSTSSKWVNKELEADAVAYDNTSSGLTATNVQGAIDEVKQVIIDTIYPIGSIYMSVSSTNPGTIFGVGTWEAWGSGRVPVGVDSNDTAFDTVEETGGNKSNSYTPAGTNSGCAVTKHTYTPAGTNSGCAVTAHTYTPAGTIGKTTLTAAQSGVHSHTHTITNTQANPSGIHTHGDYVIRALGASEASGFGLTVATGFKNRVLVHSESSSKSPANNGIATIADSGAHTHTINSTSNDASESHTHSWTGTEATLSHTVTQPTFTGTQASLTHTVTQPTFTGTAANISTVQPYITCYMWKRTA